MIRLVTKFPSVIPFLLAAILAISMAIPVFGMLPAMFGGAFIFAALVNLGIIWAAIDSLRGQLPRWVCLVPVLYFAGYYSALTMSYAHLSAVTADLSEFNEGKRAEFDPDNEQLVIPRSAFSVSYLMTQFTMPEVYTDSIDLSCGRFQSVSLTTEGCSLQARGNAIRERCVSYRREISVSVRDQTRIALQNICAVYGWGTPTKPTITVASKEIGYVSDHFVDFYLTNYEIDRGSEEPIVVKGASATLLAPFPMPLFGCFLNSARTSWGCEFKFMRDRPRVVINGMKAVAAALGLKQASIEERFPDVKKCDKFARLCP